MIKEKIMFPCEDIYLEGVLWLPEGDGPFPAVALCHPHPLYGGSMNVDMVHQVCVALGEHSIASLRFNFRGVGKSEGHYDNGVGEQKDVKAALSLLENRAEVDSSRLGLCGYSFGTMVSIPVADEDDRVQAYAGISAFFIAPNLLQEFLKPKFFVHGNRDEFIPYKEAQKNVEGLPQPKEFVLVEGADHFWGYHTGEVAAIVGRFFTAGLK